MQLYQHHISGVFQQQADALTAFAKLKAQGLPVTQMRIEPSRTRLTAPAKPANSNHVFNNMLLSGGIGATAGILLAILAEWVLVATHAPLLGAGLVVTTLALLGSGATLGMMLGATSGAMLSVHGAGASKTVGLLQHFYTWMHALVGHPQMKLSVNTYSAAETAMVAEVMHASVKLYHDEHIHPSS